MACTLCSDKHLMCARPIVHEAVFSRQPNMWASCQCQVPLGPERCSAESGLFVIGRPLMVLQLSLVVSMIVCCVHGTPAAQGSHCSTSVMYTTQVVPPSRHVVVKPCCADNSRQLQSMRTVPQRLIDRLWPALCLLRRSLRRSTTALLCSLLPNT